MISKNTIKLIKSLALKKTRIKDNLFLVEGDKNVLEVLQSEIKVEKLFATHAFLTKYKTVLKNTKVLVEVSNAEINRASLLKNPQNSLAICQLPAKTSLPEKLTNNLSVYLDDIQDPGNLGTIVRICDWFGIQQLFTSPNTADVFNPKVIQASMGSFCRVQVLKVSFPEMKNIVNQSDIIILGAFLEGKDIYSEKLPKKALLVMGNEGNGIREELENWIDRKIKIPSFSENSTGAESLNVSVATAIICSEFMRQNRY